MKIRNGFVSNSSSSSFIIKLSEITPKHLDQILNIEDPLYQEWPWRIYTCGDYVIGYADLDNFSMSRFLSNIGVSDTVIEWDTPFNGDTKMDESMFEDDND